MKWTPFPEVQGCGVLEFDRFVDERGYFEELFNRKEAIKAETPFPWAWAQDNISYSQAGVMRGFHVQSNNPQGKLVTCIAGSILDVCFDCRPNSPTFMKMTRVVLNEQTAKSFYLPPGTAHAFMALTDAIIHYRCTTPYDKESDGGFDSMSPELAFVWPPMIHPSIRSQKDMALPKLMDYVKTMK